MGARRGGRRGEFPGRPRPRPSPAPGPGAEPELPPIGDTAGELPPIGDTAEENPPIGDTAEENPPNEAEETPESTPSPTSPPEPRTPGTPLRRAGSFAGPSKAFRSSKFSTGRMVGPPTGMKYVNYDRRTGRAKMRNKVITGAPVGAGLGVGGLNEPSEDLPTAIKRRLTGGR